MWPTGSGGWGLPEGDGSALRDGRWLRGWRRGPFGGGVVGAGGEDVGSGGGHAGEDFGGLLGGFALRVDDLGEASAEGAMMIDSGVAEVFVGEGGEALGGGGGSEGAGLDGGEKFEEGGFVHLAMRRSAG